MRIGDRSYQADATGIHVSITGGQQAWAVADGIGDGPLPAYAAGSAASVASYVAAERGSVAGLLAATDALSGLAYEDTVLVVATPLPDDKGGGWDVAWVGDCRAYEYRPEHDLLAQLTLDHTRGQDLRRSLASRYEGRLDELEKLAGPHDRVVMSSVGSATESTIGHVATFGPRRRLLLTSDGVHKAVPRRSIARAARLFGDPRTCAHKLTVAAQYFGGTDNAAAMVIDPLPGHDGVGLAQ
ncbi:PP2C family protein-serine/threonine phosphatase [Amycolatopsis anabasis]|uniref:PP2C family protein-serine/threonine phosphatase n=1 Tax=Amycolatopsis anabasis TaxID=1840409 RepID=UPI00131D68CF|nr:hypothetical protein [Amycolatopsis anabasis]